MNTKITGIVAGCMLAMLAIAPLAFAHNTSGAYPTGTEARNKPSGHYFGGAGPWAEFRTTDVDPDGPGGEDPINPGFLFAVGSALCDMEILSDGSGPTSATAVLDETKVDSQGSTGGMVPDGTIDDGGQGAVCHTDSSHYSYAPYNTMGCNYGKAWARDDVGGDLVWITPGCDYQSAVPSADDPTFADLALGAVNCVTNVAVTLPSSAAELVSDCADTFLECLTGNLANVDPTDQCAPGSGGFACGPDGTVDATNSGRGMGSMISVSGGVPYPTNPCSTGVASVFVWEAVVIDNDGASPNEQGVYVATTGWVN